MLLGVCVFTEAKECYRKACRHYGMMFPTPHSLLSSEPSWEFRSLRLEESVKSSGRWVSGPQPYEWCNVHPAQLGFHGKQCYWAPCRLFTLGERQHSGHHGLWFWKAQCSGPIREASPAGEDALGQWLSHSCTWAKPSDLCSLSA